MNVGRIDQESPEYRKLRDELHEAEVALRDQRERVAGLRRKLPLDTAVPDHTLRGPVDLARADAPIASVSLSQLFESPDLPLVLMQFMYGAAQKEPCPMCTLWADGYDGIAHHLRQRANFAVLVAGDLETFRGYARGRGWRQLRLVSSEGATLKRDLGFEGPGGEQHPGVSVFAREGDGLRHFYSVSAMLGPDEFRGMDLLSPLWHFLDLTPAGRGSFMPRKSYPT